MLNTIKSKLVFFSIASILLLSLSVTFSYLISVKSIKEIMYNDVSTVADALEKQINYIAEIRPNAINEPDFKQMIYSLKLGKSGYVFMQNAAGVQTVHHSNEGANLAGNSHIDLIRKSKRGGIIEYKSVSTGQEKITAYRYIKKWDMHVVPGVNKADYFQELKSSFLKWNAIMGLVVVTVLVIISTWITKSVTGPIRGMLRIYRNMGNEQTSASDSKETREVVCRLLENMISREYR